MQYCSCNKSVIFKAGELFCSRENQNIRGLGNGLVIKAANSYRETWHTTRLSLRLSVNTRMTFITSEREIPVTNDTFLLFNQNQQYYVRSNINSVGEIITVAFNDELVDEFVRSRTNSIQNNLDNVGFQASRFLFLETSSYDEEIKNYILKFCNQLKRIEFFNEQLTLDTFCADLLNRLFGSNLLSNTHCSNLQAVKVSTRVEILKRISLAKEYIDCSYESDLSLQKIAQASMLSIPYLKKYFLEHYKISPYQYIISRRLNRIKTEIEKSTKPISEICIDYGFNNHASFSRLFKSKFGFTPSSIRIGNY